MAPETGANPPITCAQASLGVSEAKNRWSLVGSILAKSPPGDVTVPLTVAAGVPPPPPPPSPLELQAARPTQKMRSHPRIAPALV